MRVNVVATMCVVLSTIRVADAAQDGSPPPITVPPAASSAVAPPASAIVMSSDSPSAPDIVGCSGWYQTTTYGGYWATSAAAWWEYRCVQSDPYGSPFLTTDYYYWNGTASVFYGELYIYASWDVVQYWELYWFDTAANDWYGDLFYSLCDHVDGLPCDRGL